MKRKQEAAVNYFEDDYVWETAEELDQELAQRIRRIRKRRAISQERLSEMSGDRTSRRRGYNGCRK